MITSVKKRNEFCYVDFVWEEDAHIRSYRMGLENIIHGAAMETFLIALSSQVILMTGCGREKELDFLRVKEIMAAVAKKCKEREIRQCSVDISRFVKLLGEEAIVAAVLGLGLGTYEYSCKKAGDCSHWDCSFELENMEGHEEKLQEALELLKGVRFARDLVNTPGNRLRPMDMSRTIVEYMKDADVEVEILVYGQLRAMKMEAIYSIGSSSEYPPCMVILRYKGNSGSREIYGMVGKGVTCDTGGYCLKNASSMEGSKGAMAGAAAVAAAVHAAAKQRLKVNLTACLPLAENRISPTALLPGDVITSYSGQTIEVLNTDAEGRLLLADAVSYGIKEEKITKILDIATLTGTMVSMLGNTIAGTLSDDDRFYAMFEKAARKASERYLRIPYGPEHERMINSSVADVKNVGGSSCGTITAGLFVHRFCEGRPWIHVDIAGTAWCGAPTYAFESSGATGNGVTTLYYLMKEAQEDR